MTDVENPVNENINYGVYQDAQERNPRSLTKESLRMSHNNYNTHFYGTMVSPHKKSLSKDKRMREKESKLFRSLKDKTHPYFKNSMIDSCSHILVKNGQTLAVPFDIRNSKGKKLSSYKSIPTKSSELMSIYRKDFSIKPIIHAGMLNKPLEPYNPSSYRNRLPNMDFVISHKNKSSMEIGNKASASRKQWVSTYRDSFTTPVFLPICNTGILSDISKKIHKKLQEN